MKTVHRSEVGTIDSDKQTNRDKQTNSVIIRHTNEQTEKRKVCNISQQQLSNAGRRHFKFFLYFINLSVKSFISEF